MTREDDKPHHAPDLSPEVIEKLTVQAASYGMSANEYLDGLLEREREETIAAIRQGLVEIERGESIPIAEAFAAICQKYNLPGDFLPSESSTKPPRRKAGSAKGRVHMTDDFNDSFEDYSDDIP